MSPDQVSAARILTNQIIADLHSLFVLCENLSYKPNRDGAYAELEKAEALVKSVDARLS